MIDKRKLIQGIEQEEDRVIASRLYDMAQRPERGCGVLPVFLNPAQQEIAKRYFADCRPTLWGGFEESERRMVALWTQEDRRPNFPISVLSLRSNTDWVVSHRDVLGAVLNLGLARTTIGDIMPDEDVIYRICHSEIAGFIRDNLKRVARYTVHIDMTDNTDMISDLRKYKERSGTVASARADCVLAFLFSISRARAQEEIASGRVNLNWSDLSSAKTEAHEGDVYSIRGLGKADLTEIGTVTKKGRIRVSGRRFL